MTYIMGDSIECFIANGEVTKALMALHCRITELENKLKTECQHESDGLIYTSYPPQNKCIKCGEFYR